jgi:proline iminopeptidase
MRNLIKMENIHLNDFLPTIRNKTILLLFICYLNLISLGNAYAQPKYFYTSDSVKIGYLEFGKIDLPTIIFIHGGPGSNSKDFIKFAEDSKNKFRIILYDQRGGGLSQRDLTKEKISLEKMIVDLKEFQQHLKIEKANILGHSFGGAIAQEYALLYPTKVKKLIILAGLIDAKISIDDRVEAVENLVIQENNEQLLSIIEKYKTGNPLSLEEMGAIFSHPKPYWSKIRNDLNHYDMEWLGKYGYTSENFDESFFVIKLFFDSGFLSNYTFLNKGKLSTPTLLIYGSDDRATTKLQAFKLKPQLKSSKTIIIDNCGHFPHIESPEKLREILVENVK